MKFKKSLELLTGIECNIPTSSNAYCQATFRSSPGYFQAICKLFFQANFKLFWQTRLNTYLQAICLVCQASNLIERDADHFFPDGVVTSSEIISSIFLSRNQKLRVVEAPVHARSDLVCWRSCRMFRRRDLCPVRLWLLGCWLKVKVKW